MRKLLPLLIAFTLVSNTFASANLISFFKSHDFIEPAPVIKLIKDLREGHFKAVQRHGDTTIFMTQNKVLIRRKPHIPDNYICRIDFIIHHSFTLTYDSRKRVESYIQYAKGKQVPATKLFIVGIVDPVDKNKKYSKVPTSHHRGDELFGTILVHEYKEFARFVIQCLDRKLNQLVPAPLQRVPIEPQKEIPTGWLR